MTPSNANTSGLEVVAWRVRGRDGDSLFRNEKPAHIEAEITNDPVEPLVIAASAQAEITSLAEAVRRAEANETIWSDLAVEWKAKAEAADRIIVQQSACASEWQARATAAEARNAEVSMLAHRWMEAHDRLKAGLDYDLPTPADLPNEKARADRLAKALEDISSGYANCDDFQDAQDIARAALQQETQP